eukprot:3680521-Pyramimonas_sp.AAC.1
MVEPAPRLLEAPSSARWSCASASRPWSSRRRSPGYAGRRPRSGRVDHWGGGTGRLTSTRCWKVWAR